LTYGEFRALDLGRFGFDRIVAHEKIVEKAII